MNERRDDMNSLVNNKMGVARVRATYPNKNMAVVTHKMGEAHYVVFYNNILGRKTQHILQQGEFIIFSLEDVIETPGQKMPRVRAFYLIGDFIEKFNQKYTVTSQTGSMVYKGSTQGLKVLAQKLPLDEYVISKN